MLLTPSTLTHWATHSPETVVERKELMTLVEPLFNQLAVFDPRVPHGVRPVRGTRDPREARIVLHGWFVEPDMFVEGALEFEETAEVVGACMDAFSEVAETLPEATGTLVLRIEVAAGGAVDSVAFLTDTLVPRPWECGPLEHNTGEIASSRGTQNIGVDGSSSGDVVGELESIDVTSEGLVRQRQRIKEAAGACFSSCEYPVKESGSVVTMPLLFE